MNAWNWINLFYSDHGTKLLGVLTMVVAGLPQIEGLVTDPHKKYWAAANLILGAITVQRGITNTRNANTPEPIEEKP